MQEKPTASIYQEICRLAKQHPGLPYSFQPRDAGEKACRVLLGGNTMPRALRRELAHRVCEMIVAGHVEAEKLPGEDLIWYAEELRQRIRALFEADILRRDPVMMLGMRLATESRIRAEVALGVLILGQFDNDIARSVVRRIGLHGEFTPYAAVGIRGTSVENRFGFELLRHTVGYGQLALLTSFMPVTEGQKSWFLTYGIAHSVLRPLAADLCMHSPDMQKEMLTAPVDKERFHQLSCVLAYAGQMHPLKEYQVGRALAEKYVTGAEHAETFLDAAALFSVLSSWQDLPFAREALEKLHIQTLLRQEMQAPSQDPELILRVAKAYGAKIPFTCFLPMITKEYFPLCAVRYMLECRSDGYRGALFGLLKVILPKPVFEDELSSAKMPQDKTHRPDVWLEALLVWMSEAKDEEEEFYLRCLSARSFEVRLAALRALRSMRESWTEAVAPALANLLEKEPLDKVKKSARRLLDAPRWNEGPGRGWMDPAPSAVEPSERDRMAMHTCIEDAWFTDLTQVEGTLSAGDMILLIRKTEEPDRIIALTEDGYVLGRLPARDTEKLVQKMDAGERYYARLTENMHDRCPQVDVYWSPTFRTDGKIVYFPGMQ